MFVELHYGSGTGKSIGQRPRIRLLQSMLNRKLHLRPPLKGGVYGKRTQAAVAEFQRREGLEVDGVYGPITSAALWGRLPLRLRALNYAKTLVGVMEQGGNNVGPVVSKIIRANGGTPGEPWCGDFVAYVYRHAGSRAVQRAWASVYYLGILSGLRYISPRAVQPGDIVRYNFDHTGLFYRWVGPGEFEAIEGNTGATGAVSDSTTGGDGVYIKRRSLSLVTDFRRVTR